VYGVAVRRCVFIAAQCIHNCVNNDDVDDSNKLTEGEVIIFTPKKPATVIENLQRTQERIPVALKS